MITLKEFVERFTTKQACADHLNWSRQLLDARLSAKKQVWVCEGRFKWYIEGGALGEVSEQPLLDPDKVLRGGGYGMEFEFKDYDGDWVKGELIGFDLNGESVVKTVRGGFYAKEMRARPGQKVPREWLK